MNAVCKILTPPAQHDVIDVDGDGREELLIRRGDPNPLDPVIVRIENDFKLSTQSTNMPRLEQQGLYWAPRMMDVNGDGLMDFFQGDAGNSFHVDINRGNGKFDRYTQSMPPIGGPGLATRLALLAMSVPMDVNGDGMQDLVVPSLTNWMWLRSNGTSFTLEQFPAGARVPFDRQDPRGRTSAFDQYFDAPVAADLDGDGSDDILEVKFAPNWHKITFRTPERAELRSITDSLGARTEIHYSALKKSEVYTGAGSCNGAQFPAHCEHKTKRRVVSDVRFWDQPADNSANVPPGTELTLAPPTRERTFKYEGGRTDLQRQSWLGFGKVDITDLALEPRAPREVSHTQLLFDNATYRAQNRRFPFAHHANTEVHEVNVSAGRKHVTSTSRVFEQKVSTQPSSVDPVATAFTFVRDEWFVERDDASTDHFFVRKVFTHYDDPDGVGNVKHFHRTWQQGGTATDELDVTTKFLYETQPAVIDRWQIDLVQSREETSKALGLLSQGDPNAVATRKYEATYYDNGLLHTRTRAPEDPRATVVTTFMRDDFGNPKVITINDDTTKIDYDDVGAFPIVVTNAKNQRTQVRVDSRFGQITRIIDPNNLTTDRWYDEFGLLRMTVALDNTTQQFDFESRYTDMPLTTKARETGGEEITIEYDVLGRPVRSRRTGVRDDIIEQRQTYDTLGRIDSVQRPHKTTLSAPEMSIYAHDDLGRVTRVTLPDGGELQRCYRGPIHCATNTRGFTSCQVFDALGRLARSLDPEPTPIPCEQALDGVAELPGMTYTYGAFSELRFVDDMLLNRITKVLTDPYGRPTLVEDRDHGQRSMHFDPLDRVDLVTDANGNSFSMGYDALGRLVQRDQFRAAFPVTQTTRWFWDGDGVDVQGEFVGALTRIQSPEGHSTTYHYDPATGRPSSVDTHIAGSDGGTFTTSMVFDGATGLLTDLVYPKAAGQEQVTAHHSYDAHGHLLSVDDPTHHFAASSFWKLDDGVDAMDDYDQLHKEVFGNEIRTTRSYKENGWIREITSKKGESILQDLKYEVDQEGNILSRNDLKNSQWEAFGYDKLDRVTCSTLGTGSTPGRLGDGCALIGGGPAQSRYQYDDMGRLMSKANVGSYAYAGTTLHAPSTAGTTSYTYDANGNRQTETDPAVGTKHFTWTPYNKPLEIWREGAAQEVRLDLVHLEYDGEQNRVRKDTDYLTTLYIGGIAERRIHKDPAVPGQSLTEYVFYISNGMRTVAQVTQKDTTETGTVEYLHDDHLGSTHLVTSGTATSDAPLGTVLDERSYDTFGQARNKTWASTEPPSTNARVTAGFTGHEADLEHGLVNMRGREYDPRIGQFVQPDPFVQAPHFSQSWNHYAYAFNNPLKLIDPSGFANEGADAGTTTEKANEEPSKPNTPPADPPKTQPEKKPPAGSDTPKQQPPAMDPNKDGVKEPTPPPPPPLPPPPPGKSEPPPESGGGAPPSSQGGGGGGGFFTGDKCPGAALCHDAPSEGHLSTEVIFDYFLGGLEGTANGPIGPSSATYNSTTNLEYAVAVVLIFRGPKGKGKAFSGTAYEIKHIPKHLPGTRAAERLIAREGKAHVFKDMETLARVENEIAKHGQFTGTVRGTERFGVMFNKPIGMRVGADGTVLQLFYGEAKVSPNGLYHVTPRTGPAKP